MDVSISKVDIIEYRPQYLSELRNLFLKIRKNTFSWMDPSSFQLLDFDKETKEEYILVAFYNNRLIAFISVWLPDNFIHHLYIDDGFRNLGIGTKLLNKIIDKIGYPVRLKCLEKNQSAINFYLKRGFIIKDRGISDGAFYLSFELKGEKNRSCH